MPPNLETLADRVKFLIKTNQSNGQDQSFISSSAPTAGFAYIGINSKDLGTFIAEFNNALFGMFDSYLAIQPRHNYEGIYTGAGDREKVNFPNLVGPDGNFGTRNIHNETSHQQYSAIVGGNLIFLSLKITTGGYHPIGGADYEFGFEFYMHSPPGTAKSLVNKVKTGIFPVLDKYDTQK